MRYSKERVDDFDLAWEMAIVENPYRELASLATKHGLNEIAKNMAGRARQASYEAEKSYKALARVTKYTEIEKASETPLLVIDDFVRQGGKSASNVWHFLRHTVEENPELPIEFIEFAPDEYVLRGDFGAASKALGSTRAKIILGDIAQSFVAEQP